MSPRNPLDDQTETSPAGSFDSHRSSSERRDETLRRMLKTPPKRHGEMKLGRGKGKPKSSKGNR